MLNHVTTSVDMLAASVAIAAAFDGRELPVPVNELVRLEQRKMLRVVPARRCRGVSVTAPSFQRHGSETSQARKSDVFPRAGAESEPRGREVSYWLRPQPLILAPCR